MTKNSFIWAQAKNANVLEPLKELSEHGWRQREIPKASNMNWIFKQISDDLNTQRKDLLIAKEHTSSEIQKSEEKFSLRLEQLKKDIFNGLESIKEEQEVVKTRVKILRRATEFNYGVCRQVKTYLRHLEIELNRLNKDFTPSFPIPSIDDALRVREEVDAPRFPVEAWPLEDIPRD